MHWEVLLPKVYKGVVVTYSASQRRGSVSCEGRDIEFTNIDFDQSWRTHAGPEVGTEVSLVCGHDDRLLAVSRSERS